MNKHEKETKHQNEKKSGWARIFSWIRHKKEVELTTVEESTSTNSSSIPRDKKYLPIKKNKPEEVESSTADTTTKKYRSLSFRINTPFINKTKPQEIESSKTDTPSKKQRHYSLSLRLKDKVYLPGMIEEIGNLSDDASTIKSPASPKNNDLEENSDKSCSDSEVKNRGSKGSSSDSDSDSKDSELDFDIQNDPDNAYRAKSPGSK